MNEIYYNADFGTKRQNAVKSRAECGLMFLSGVSEKAVVLTLFWNRPKGVL